MATQENRPNARMLISDYLKHPRRLGQQTQRFRFEIVVCRATGLRSVQSNQVWVECVRRNVDLHTTK